MNEKKKTYLFRANSATLTFCFSFTAEFSFFFFFFLFYRCISIGDRIAGSRAPRTSSLRRRYYERHLSHPPRDEFSGKLSHPKCNREGEQLIALFASARHQFTRCLAIFVIRSGLLDSLSPQVQATEVRMPETSA